VRVHLLIPLAAIALVPSGLSQEALDAETRADIQRCEDAKRAAMAGCEMVADRKKAACKATAHLRALERTPACRTNEKRGN
jgi:hypothetical protein